MRKIFSTMMLVAAAAMAFVSCQKEEQNAPAESVTLTFTSETPVTRTEWNGETIVWSDSDKIRMALTIGDAWYKDKNGKIRYYVSSSTTLSETSETASFKISNTFDTAEEGDYKFYTIYPSDCTGTDTEFAAAPIANYTIPSVQEATSSTFHKSSDILWGKSVDKYQELPKSQAVPLVWTRLVAHAYITLKGLPAGEVVNSVTLTAQEGAAVVGKYNLDITKGEVTDNKPTNSVTVNCTDVTVNADGEATFWACINPCKVESLNIVVDTDKAVYSIDKTNLELYFLVNKRNIQPVNMSAAERTPKDFTGAELPFEETFESCTTTSNSALEVLDGFASVLNVYPNSGAVKFATGDKNAALTTKLLDLSSPFYVKVLARGYDEDEVTLTVKAGEQSKVITMVTFGSTSGDFVEYIVNFEAVDNSESVIFETATGKRLFIDNIYIGEGSAVAAPMIVAQTPAKVAANGGTGEIVYTVYNEVEGVNLTASSNESWLKIVSTTGGKVAFTADPNDLTEERTATVTLTYGAATETVTVTQDKKAPTDAVYYVKVTENVNDLSGTYLWVCEEKFVAFAGIASDGYADLASISISDGKIESNATTDQYQIVITKSGSNYLIKYGDKYVAYNTSTKFKLSTSDTDDASKWNITINSYEAAITSVSASTRHVYWSTTSGNCFALYTSKGSYKYVQLYKLQSN